MNLYRRSPLAAGLLGLVAGVASAAETATRLDPVQVTATKDEESIYRIPASISVVTGEELRARGAYDLRTALALVAGVEGTPGGDGGPAGSVPALWGLREQDSYLLVIDGVPAGGAFNPATPAVDVTGVERIEVLRGAAPVMYGATSFNGVIHVIHYAPGKTPTTVSAGGGSYGSFQLSGATSLSSVNGYNQSFSANIEQRGYKTDREQYNRYHLLYRGASVIDGIGNFHTGIDVSIVPQTPGNVVRRNGATLRTDIIPLDANANPANAKLDQKRVQFDLGLDGKSGSTEWATTLSLARTTDDIVRGFLRGDAPTLDPDGNDADGFDQKRSINDLYFDAHVINELGSSLKTTLGFDWLHGKAKASANNYAYFANLDGSGAQDSSTRPVDEIAIISNERDFYGVYAQADWTPVASVDVLAGVRLNRTNERAAGQAIDIAGGGAGDFIGEESRSFTRASGTFGIAWHAARALTVYADYRNTFKPKATDLGPEAESSVPNPETTQSYEAGLKGALVDGRLSYDLSVFQLDFKNLKTLDIFGNDADNGTTRFKGAELETRFALAGALSVAANYAYHDSRFVDFNRDGTPGGVVNGNRFEMAPFHLAGLGLLYTPPQGLNGTVTANYAGERRLNKSNSLSQPGYTTVDATLGYHAGKYGVMVNGYNLTDRRVPIAESEMADELFGVPSYYFLQARSVMVNFSMDL